MKGPIEPPRRLDFHYDDACLTSLEYGGRYGHGRASFILAGFEPDLDIGHHGRIRAFNCPPMVVAVTQFTHHHNRVGLDYTSIKADVLSRASP